MYTQPTPFPVSDPHAASRYCWQGNVYYDSRDYADFPLRNDAAGTPLSTAAYQASRIPLSEDGRRCLIGLLSTLAGYQQSRLLQALASSHFLGLPIQVATLAQGLYTAVMEGHHRSAFILSSLTLACRHLPADCHPLILLAGELRHILCHWLGDALAESLFGQDLPQSVSASLLSFSCCAAALYLCHDPAAPAAEPQRRCLRLPRCLVTLLYKGQLFWGLLNALADRATPSGPTPRQIGVHARQRQAGTALCRQRPARLSWDKALAKRLGAQTCPATPQQRAITAAARSRGVKVVNVLHPAVMMPALLAIGTSTPFLAAKNTRRDGARSRCDRRLSRLAFLLSGRHGGPLNLTPGPASPESTAAVPSQTKHPRITLLVRSL